MTTLRWYVLRREVTELLPFSLFVEDRGSHREGWGEYGFLARIICPHQDTKLRYHVVLRTACSSRIAVTKRRFPLEIPDQTSESKKNILDAELLYDIF